MSLRFSLGIYIAEDFVAEIGTLHLSNVTDQIVNLVVALLSILVLCD